MKTHGNMFQYVAHLARCPKNTRKDVPSATAQSGKEPGGIFGNTPNHILYLQKYKMDSTTVILTFFCPKNMYNMWAFEHLCKMCKWQGLMCKMPLFSKIASPSQNKNSTILKLAKFHPKSICHISILDQW